MRFIASLLAAGLLSIPALDAAAASVPADTITLESHHIPQPMKITVATPGGDGPYPTLYLLNGYNTTGGDYRKWPMIVDIDSVAREHQMIVVCPSGMNSWYWDAPAQPEMQMESFFIEKLVPAIDSLYPTIPEAQSRAITGFSMGGHGAMWLALRHPDIWRHVGATSGGVDIRPFPDSWTMAHWLGKRDSVPEVWNAHTVMTLAQTMPDSVLNSLDIFIDCGTEDFFYGVNCALDSVLSNRRIHHTFATYPGAHNLAYWSKSILPQIDHFSKTISRKNSQSAMTMNFSSPRMKLFLPDPAIATGRAIVCCPGGGYSKVAAEHEGYAWAPFFNDLGIAFAVVDYDLPGGDRTIPMADIEKAFGILTDSTSIWHINPDDIGIMGFSAGGHLASTMATHPQGACRPAFQILFYPVISLDEKITHAGTRRGFLGDKPSAKLVREWSADKSVTTSTPPAFIVLSGDDKGVPPVNSLNYYSALSAAGVPAELIIFPDGGHGWGFKPDSPHHTALLSALSAYLSR